MSKEFTMMYDDGPCRSTLQYRFGKHKGEYVTVECRLKRGHTGQCQGDGMCWGDNKPTIDLMGLRAKT